jgi:hypothetical protein
MKRPPAVILTRYVVSVEHSPISPFIVCGADPLIIGAEIHRRMEQHIIGAFEVILLLDGALRITGPGRLQRPDRTMLGLITLRHYGVMRDVA